ncbi:MAG: glycerol-3-phosphate dehydrogenase/oxidase [Chloroflexota bacterium]
MDRQAILQNLQQDPTLPVLIIGAGINGIGTFRDLALQGVDVLIIDKDDFCSGTSAASSHMVHGGIRYLENGEFRLVQEAVQERNRLLKNAPHYVKPLATVIPIFKMFSGIFNAPLKFLGVLDKPSERGAFVIKAGLQMYDAYTRLQGAVPKHRFDNRKVSLKRFPKLNRQIAFTATYYDAAMPSPERICVELILDGEAAHDRAMALNYVQAVSANGDTVTLRDCLTGSEITVKPQIVINAAGPWIDFTNQALNRPTKFIGGTKGSHLVLDHPILHQAIDGHEFFFENEDGRIVLIYPLMDKVLIGTSDIRIDDPAEARCTEDEIDYFLDMLDKVFPDIQVNRSHIVFRFSGVRPLPAMDASRTGQISRDHSIRTIEPDDQIKFPILALIGGKWTTFRAFSEKTADTVLKRLGQKRHRSTKDIAIGGGADYPHTDQAQQQWLSACQDALQIDADRLATLFDRYGTRAKRVAAFIMADEDTMLAEHPKFSRREIMFLVQEEKVQRLDDLILRRSLLGMLGEVTPQLLHELADITAIVLDWSVSEREAEIERTVALFADKHDVILSLDRVPEN